MTAADIERSKEVDMVTLRTDAHYWCVPPARPDMRRGGLKIQTHLIHAQHLAVRMCLQEVRHFFSAVACQSAMAAADGLLRYTLAARW